jgi:MoaA/NifB/PqqE/SkfB family radical SAM enzyme
MDAKILFNHRIAENAELNVREALDRTVAPKSLPQRIIVQVTNRCQLSCPMCLIDERRELIDLSDELLDKIACEVVPYGKYVALSGGEPLLYVKLPELIDKFSSTGGPVIDAVTNAIRLNDALIEQVVQKGVILYVSLNGATTKTHESTRPGTKFDSIVRKLKKIDECKNRIGSNTPVGISYVMLKNNVAEMPKVIDLMHEVGAEIIRFGFYLAGSDFQRLHFLPDQDKKLINEYFLETRAKAIEHGITAYVPKFYVVEEDDKYNAHMRQMEEKYPLIEHPIMQAINYTFNFGDAHECHEPWTTTVIDMEGLVHPCCLSYITLGDLKKQSFMEIWHGEPYRRLRESVNTDNALHDCKVCPSYAPDASLVSADAAAAGPVSIDRNSVLSLLDLGHHYLKTEGLVSTTKRLNAFVMRRIKKQ